MKKNLKSLVTAVSILLAFSGAVTAQTVATLEALHDGDGLPIAPVPGTDDQYQLSEPGSSGSPPGMNYYINNGDAPGQTFTTGSSANGYIMNSLAFYDAGDSGGMPVAGQPYYLNIYILSEATATLYTRYISDNVIFYDGYWYQWTNINVPLLPNTKYAYTVSQTPGDSGWFNLGNVSGDLYPDPTGEIVAIPRNGGTVVHSSATGYDAAFDIGMTPATNVVVGALIVSPANAVTSGTPVTISASLVVGAGPLSYQWQTDGGSGTLTNIPGATSSTLSVDTTGTISGGYKYAVIVANGDSAATNSTLLGIYQNSTAVLFDIGSSITPAAYDISQLTSGGAADNLNYYDDNNPPPGQTFTTGSNEQGYYLTSLTVGTGGQSGGTSGHTSSLKPYTLQIYKIDGGSAALIASYTNSSFSFTFGDWLAWSGFSPLLLKPNTTYAYTFHLWPTSEGGWAAMSVSDSNPYADGQICMIPITGGAITYGSSGLSDAAFDIGLSPVGLTPTTPLAGAIVVSPARNVLQGTPVTFTETATGAEPLDYQWQTDGGSGGEFTNVPAATGTNLVQDTAGWNPGIAYRYQVIVSNVYGSSTSVVASVTTYYPVATAVVADAGADAPMPTAIDIAQTNPASGANNPDGLNYYYNNDAPPGQTFTTGNNPSGYTLNTLSIDLAGNANLQSQTFTLRIYAVSGNTATLYATYNSQDNFIMGSATDWMQWSGLGLPLAPDTTYAYTLYGHDGWCNLANINSNPYSGGEACLIPPGGGAISFGSSHDYDGVFVLGMTLSGYPGVSQPTFSPASPVYAGTPVIASADVSGDGPFTYQWQTDGGSGIFTNIPDATNPTLSVDTSGLSSMTVGYDLVVGNGSGSTTGRVSVLTIMPAQVPTFTTDITNSLYQPSSQLTTFVGGSVTLSDTNIQGTFPVSYQWQTDGGTLTFTNIPGATNSSLTLANLTVSDSGNYLLIATNSQGPGQTTYASLTVLPQPANPFAANFQFHTMVNADVGNYAGLGVIGTGTYWNQVIGSTEFYLPGSYYTSSSGYSDDGITNCGIFWTLICDNSWGWSSSPTIPLLDSAANAYVPSTFVFTLPNGLYNLVLYSCNGTEAGTPNHTESATFTVNGVSKTILPTTDQEFLLNNNYVIFTNVVVTNATLVGTWSSTNDFASLNAVQLQYFGVYKPLSIQATNGQVKLEWSPGTLLEAPALTGPWTTNMSSSPYIVTPTNSQMFFKVQVE